MKTSRGTVFTIFIISECLKAVFTLPEVACPGFDVRSSPSNFIERTGGKLKSLLNRCTVIEGNVHLILMTQENITIEHFSSIRFPRVREITGYLLVFQLRGLLSLEYIFPELRVIRGTRLVHNYALVLFQNPTLSEIGLSKLTTISRGGVRIFDNPQLCYVDTVNWTEITREPPMIERNKASDMCADKCKDFFNVTGRCATRKEKGLAVDACWNYQTCQKVCPLECQQRNLSCTLSHLHESACCHPQCVGGCTGPTASDCYACKNVYFNDTCVERCPSGYYRFLDRRCVTKDECHNTNTIYNIDNEDAVDTYVYKAMDLNGKCDLACPDGYEEDQLDRRKCQKCSNVTGCSKHCVMNATIQSLSDATALSGCTHLVGSLDIMIYTGLSKNVIKILEEHLSRLKEVSDYVKVSFTPSLVSLNVLKNLRKIEGQRLWNDKYALSVFENANLAQLWNFDRNGTDTKTGTENPQPSLKITRGILQFQNNPQLCYQRIMDLASYLRLTPNITQHDVSLVSNGYKAVCEKVKLNLKLVYVDNISIVVQWDKFNTTTMDFRMFLGYKFYYKEVDSDEINIFDSRDACSDSWIMKFHETNSHGTFIDGLKPFTMYAFYVQTSMVSSPGAKGGISDVKFARTKFSPPSEIILKNITSLTYDSIYVEWSPPSSPHGQVTHYMLSIRPIYDELPLERNYCSEPPDYSKNLKTTKNFNDPFRSHLISSFDPASLSNQKHCSRFKCCDCNSPLAAKHQVNTTGISRLVSKDDLVVERSVFENQIYDVIFKKETRYRRSVKLTNSKGQIERDLLAHNRSSMLKSPSLFSSTALYYNGADKQRITVNVTSLNFTFTGLKHFTTYGIKIWACQNVSVEDNFCSRMEINEYLRTLLIVEKDQIDESSMKIVDVVRDKLNVSQKYVTWKAPFDPNGLIVSYLVQYKRDKTEKSFTECIGATTHNLTGGIYLSDLLPGNYTLRVRAVSLAQRGPWTKFASFTIPQKNRMSDTTLILMVVCCSIIVIISIIVGFLIYRRRFPKKLPEYIIKVFSANPDYLSHLEVYKPDEWELKRSDIELLEELGRGTFGRVYEGRGNHVTTVKGVRFGECAVKTVGEGASLYDKWHFLYEATMMKEFDSAYVVKLYGVVSEGQPALVVMELMHRGNLRQYLMSRRPDSENNIYNLDPPTYKEIMRMAGEIADGMAYLAAQKFCHRDLAARNCMVAGDGTCKIGDFGMARDLHLKDYYRLQGKRLLPFRWMAPEALRDGTFTSKSDVWSYGVVLWEIVTLASQPYPGLSNDDLFSFVVDCRQTMDIPKGCPTLVARMMSSCWQYYPRDRPTFVQLVAELLAYQKESFYEESYFCTSFQSVDGLSLFQNYQDETDYNGGVSSSSRPPSSYNETDPDDSAIVLDNFYLPSGLKNGGYFLRSDRRKKDEECLLTGAGDKKEISTKDSELIPLNEQHVNDDDIGTDTDYT